MAPYVRLLQLNRPQVATSVNTRMGEAFLALWDGLVAEPARYYAMVLTRAGERAFCAGGDLKQRGGMSDERWQSWDLVFERMMCALLTVSTAIIGACGSGRHGL
ncbi:MAG TPA: enoyl-CoA hydratase/isomerase family protein [Sphingomonas sp.]|uniref:enoyl-CoA hydratase/isomerase family protein n=1 Tax=Sphingomonas sp. TaxID=28214 RepID=UPI002EDB1115